MADLTFYDRTGPLSIEEIVRLLENKHGVKVTLRGNPSRVIDDVAALSDATEKHLSFLDNRKYIAAFSSTGAGACLVHPDHVNKAPKETTLLVTETPYAAYAFVAGIFYPDRHTATIHPSAIIDPSATIGTNCTIGPCVVIGRGVTIGANSTINAHCTIQYAMLGENVLLHPGVCIGQDGFGFATYEGKHVTVPQLGRVIIGNDVEIGANTTIDRGSGPDTVIGEGCRIDNLVQIGHNVTLGHGCVLVAKVGIAGSTTIGDYCVIGGQVGIAGHLTIGNYVQIAAQSGVMRNIDDGEIVGGAPAVPIRQWHKQNAFILRQGKR